MTKENSLQTGSLLMLLGALGFFGYGLIFLFKSLFGPGFELGVDTIGGFMRDQLHASNPTTFFYIMHVHIALSAFIIATSIAVASLSWYGVRKGEKWAFVTAVISPVVALVIALPIHYQHLFPLNHLTHLGPIYLSTLVFVIGSFFSLKSGLLK